MPIKRTTITRTRLRRKKKEPLVKKMTTAHIKRKAT